MNPKVSVIVPVYNVEKYLARCLDSLTSQTLDEIEILVVNDGTKDGSQSIIDAYKLRFPDKVISFIKENGGLGDARNYGMKYARADFISFVDSDDYVEPTMIERMYTKAIKEQADIVLCDIEYVWENSDKKILLKGLKQVENVTVEKSIYLSPLFAWNKLYRRSLFSDYRLEYPKRLWYEDIPVTLPLFSLVKIVSYVDEVLVHYVQRESSIMGTNDSPKLFDIFVVLDEALNFYKGNDILQTYHEELEFVYIEQLMLYGSFRFYRSNIGQPLMLKAIDVMSTDFPRWKQNKYLLTLPFKYRLYLKLLNQYTMPFFKALVQIKGRLA